MIGSMSMAEGAEWDEVYNINVELIAFSRVVQVAGWDVGPSYQPQIQI
jgi:hypothetical protein